MTTNQPHLQSQRPTSWGDSDTQPADEERGPSALSDDEKFSLLSNQRRRRALRYLSQHDGQATLEEIAEHIAAEEHDTTVEQLTSDQRKRVYVGLYQTHMPSLDDDGVIDYDKDRGTVRMTPKAEQLLPYLDSSNGEDGRTGERQNQPSERTDRYTERGDLSPRVVALMSAAAVVAATGVLAGSGLIRPGFGWTVVGVLVLAVIVALRTTRRSRRPSIDGQ